MTLISCFGFSHEIDFLVSLHPAMVWTMGIREKIRCHSRFAILSEPDEGQDEMSVSNDTFFDWDELEWSAMNEPWDLHDFESPPGYDLLESPGKRGDGALSQVPRGPSGRGARVVAHRRSGWAERVQGLA